MGGAHAGGAADESSGSPSNGAGMHSAAGRAGSSTALEAGGSQSAGSGGNVEAGLGGQSAGSGRTALDSGGSQSTGASGGLGGSDDSAGVGGSAAGNPEPAMLPNGAECAASSECESGHCADGESGAAKSICCQSGYANCGACIDEESDDAHCGSCSKVCAANQTCESGTCTCTGYTFPSTCGGGCGSWTFESGTTEGWSVDTDPSFPVNGGDGNGVTNVTTTSNRVHDGSRALAVPGSTGAGPIVSVAAPVCQAGASVNMAGFTMSAWVYLTGTDLSTYSFLFFDAWGPSSQASSPVLTGTKIMSLNTWYQLTATFSSTVQADHVAIRLNPEMSWTGTMYIDSVTVTGP
jgi:hypothetical protein